MFDENECSFLEACTQVTEVLTVPMVFRNSVRCLRFDFDLIDLAMVSNVIAGKC